MKYIFRGKKNDKLPFSVGSDLLSLGVSFEFLDEYKRFVCKTFNGYHVEKNFLVFKDTQGVPVVVDDTCTMVELVPGFIPIRLFLELFSDYQQTNLLELGLFKTRPELQKVELTAPVQLYFENGEIDIICRYNVSYISKGKKGDRLTFEDIMNDKVLVKAQKGLSKLGALTLLPDDDVEALKFMYRVTNDFLVFVSTQGTLEILRDDTPTVVNMQPGTIDKRLFLELFSSYQQTFMFDQSIVRCLDRGVVEITTPILLYFNNGRVDAVGRRERNFTEQPEQTEVEEATQRGLPSITLPHGWIEGSVYMSLSDTTGTGELVSEQVQKYAQVVTPSTPREKLHSRQCYEKMLMGIKEST